MEVKVVRVCDRSSVYAGFMSTTSFFQKGRNYLMLCGGSQLDYLSRVGKCTSNVRLATKVSGETRMVRPNQIVYALSSGQLSSSGDGPQDEGDARGAPLQNGGTRLGRLLRERQKDLLDKFNSIRRNLPLKVFLLLLGFYSANALATILGQTGDWDVLVAGFLVAVIEGIGIIIYKMPIVEQKFLMIMRLINYWKAGMTFGLFVDAFKLGS